MQFLDISVAIGDDLPTWPGDPRPQLHQEQSIAAGNAANVTRLEMGIHTGTHIDAPRHFLADGAPVDDIPLRRCVGPTWVVDLRGVKRIGGNELDRQEIPDGTERLLLKTDNSALWREAGATFQEDFAALTRDGARWLVGSGISLVGIDYLSIQRFDDPPDTHVELLRAGIVILEGLDLSEAQAGSYTLYCLPLKLLGAEGAPARAVLVTE